MSDIHQNKILILDFGSQYTQLIARRVREIGVYCELVPYDVNPYFIENFNPNGIILSEVLIQLAKLTQPELQISYLT